MAKKTRRGQKQCPKCGKWVKGTRAKACPKCGHQFAVGQQAAPALEPAPATPERPTKPSDTLTLEHVKAVAKTVKAIGGFDRLNELLAVIKEVGGIRRFKDLLEAMAVPEADDIPY